LYEIDKLIDLKCYREDPEEEGVRAKCDANNDWLDVFSKKAPILYRFAL